MNTPAEVRIDKWLWAVRIYKTRTIAAEACRGGHVEINGQKVKPSHVTRLNEIVCAKLPELTKTVKVIALIDKRVGAGVVKEYLEDLTPPEEYNKSKTPYFPPLFARKKGEGRPTKKDRRAMDRFANEKGSDLNGA